MIRHRSVASIILAAALLAACSRGDNRGQAAPTPSPGPSVTPAGSPPGDSPSPTAAPPVTGPAPPSPAASPAPPSVAATCPVTPTRVSPPADRPRYRLRVDVRLAERVAEGDVSVRFTPDLPTDRLVFRLWPNAPIMAGAGVHLDAGPVTVAGAAAPATQPDPTTLVVSPGRTIARGEAVDVAMPWRLALAGPVNERVSLAGDSVRMGSFFPLLAWDPGHGWAIDAPTTVHGETSTSPAADFDTTITVPAGYSVLATGVPDGGGRWLAEGVPDVGLSVGRFVTAETTAAGGGAAPVRITVGVAPGVEGDPAAYAAKVARSVASHAARFGPYPWPVYTLALTPALPGGLEYPMHVMQGPGTIGRSTSHEVGHQWFYALVLNNQARDPWLDEALATWAESGVERSLPSFVRRSIPAEARGRTGSPMSYWDAHADSYYRGVYVQGTQALAALGPPELVDCALRSYVAANAYRIARPDDLLNSLTRVFPAARDVFSRYGVVG